MDKVKQGSTHHSQKDNTKKRGSRSKKVFGWATWEPVVSLRAFLAKITHLDIKITPKITPKNPL